MASERARQRAKLVVAVVVAFAAGVAVTLWRAEDGGPPDRASSAQRTGDDPTARASKEAERRATETTPRRLTGRAWPKPKEVGAQAEPTSSEPERATPRTSAEPGTAERNVAPPEGDAIGATADSAETGLIVSGDGVLRGVAIRGESTVPDEASIDPSADPKCRKLMGSDPQTSTYRIENGRVAEVFVYVANIPKGRYEVPSTPVTLDQKNCRFEPQVFGIRAKQKLEIRNSDPTLHNVHAFATRGEFNLAMPRQGQVRTRRFRSLEPLDAGAVRPVPIRCDVHPWMKAHAFVMDHPFFAVTDREGRFEISGLPDGKYQLVAWHAGFVDGAWQRGTVEILNGVGTYEIDMRTAGTQLSSRDVLKRVLRRYATITDLSARFELTFIRLDDTGLRKASGRLRLKKPNLQRWDYESPRPKVVIFDGDDVLSSIWSGRLEDSGWSTTNTRFDSPLPGRMALQLHRSEGPNVVLTVNTSTLLVEGVSIHSRTDGTNHVRFSDIRLDENHALALFNDH